MVNLSKGCLIASNLQHVLKIFLFKIYKNNVQHVFIDLKIHFLKIPRLMFCKAAFINRRKGKCQKDFQHGQRTEEGLAAIQFGPLFSVSTIIIILMFFMIFFSVSTIIIILIFLMIFFGWYSSRWAPSSRGKVMSQGANKLQTPFLANSIYSRNPISKMSINSCENRINSCRH